MADTRKCIGSARFGIEPHEAPIGDFPKQLSQPGGLGRMCKAHWKAYVNGLTADRKAKADATPAEKAANTGAKRAIEAAAAVGAIHPVPKPAKRVKNSRGGRKPQAIRTRKPALHIDQATGATVLTPEKGIPVQAEAGSLADRVLAAGTDTPMGLEDDLAGAQVAEEANA